MTAVPARAISSVSDGFVPDADPRTWRLMFMGRMDRLKGLRVLLDALKFVRSRLRGRIELTIAGDGPDMERVREAARRVVTTLPDVDVIFLGWTSREQCDEQLGASDALVMPSLWPEPFGLAGLEALNRGVPVAAFAVGGIPEWLEDGRTGALAPGNPPSASGLADAIVRCLTVPEIRNAVSDRSHLKGGTGSTNRHVEALMPLLAVAATSSTTRITMKLAGVS